MSKSSFRVMVAKGRKWAAFVVLVWLTPLFFSCEDPGILSADRNFSRSTLQTVFVDTFSVVTSTVLFDSLPTSNSNLILLGDYKDNLLGRVSSSTYFQIAPLTLFLPNVSSSYDSVGLVMSYNDYWYGDTTKTVNINIYPLAVAPRPRIPVPYQGEDRVSIFTASSALYNTSQTSFGTTPITSYSVRFTPRRDSVYIPLPLAFGKRWFDVAKADTTPFFRQPSLFVTDFFKGFHISTTSIDGASLAGFRAGRCKVRLFYKTFINDEFKQTRFDFPIVNAALQYNRIVADRAGTALASLVRRQPIPSAASGNVSYVQSGVGIATKIEFPSLKKFFLDKRYILIDAVLDVYPVQNTYLGNTLPPPNLAMFRTDNSNVPVQPVPPFDRSTALSSNVFLDREYAQQTRYSFPLINYVSTELLSQSEFISPVLITALPPALTTQVNRVAIGNRSHPTNKTKLKIYYSYVPN